MGESSEKSDPKVDAAPAVVSTLKSAKEGIDDSSTLLLSCMGLSGKGKRETEDEPEKQVSTKKQKRDEAAQNQKDEAKVQKKKEISSDDSDSEEDESKVAPAACEDGSNSTKKKAESSPNTDSKSSDKDDLKTKETTLPTPAAGKKESAKKFESNEDLDSDSDSRTVEDNVTMSSKKLLTASAAGNIIPAKKVESSDVLSSDCSSDEDDVQETHATSSFKKLPAEESCENVSEESKKIEEKPSKTQKIVEDEEMVDETSTEAIREEIPKIAATPKDQKATSNKIFVGNLSYSVGRADLENLFKDCGEIVNVRFGTNRDGRFKGFGHVEFSTEEAAQKALKLNGNELFRRYIRIEIAREKGAYTSGSRNNWLKGFYTTFGEDEPKISASPIEQNATSKTLFVGNLSYSVERVDLENFFKDCGEIVDIRFATDRDGRFKGFGHVEFATEKAAQNALTLNGNELLRRSVRLDIAPERGAYSCNSNSRNDSSEKAGSDQLLTVFVKGSGTSLGKDELKMPAIPKEQNLTSKTVFVGNLSYSVEKADLENLFKDCGEIVDIRLATDREGRFKGFGHVEFATKEAAQNALKLNGTELLRHYVRLDLAREKGANSSNSRNDSFPKGGSGETQTVFVRGFDTSIGEDEIRTSLEEHFSSCGMILRISIARDHDTGAVKGFAWLDFKDVDGFNKALELDGTEVGGYTLSVEERRPRRYNQGSGGAGSHLGGWREDDQWGQGRCGSSRWR